MEQRKKLFLVDAYALIFRYYYAFISRPMRNRDGLNTSVIYGFTKFLRDILKREKPDLLGVAFDPPGGCDWRREMLPQYKANRAETPEDIIASVPHVKRVVEAMRIPILEVPCYEADDVIGTLSVKAEKAGYEVYMVTPDKDYNQLVQPHVKIYRQKGEGVEIVDMEAIKEHYGFDDPLLVRDVLAIWGDAADNIPGVKGIGEKGAIKLINQFGDVESILANLDQITGKQHENLMAGAEQLRVAKKITTIALDTPIEFLAEALKVEEPDTEKLREIYTEMNFSSFLRELAPATQQSNNSEPTPKKQQRKSVLRMEGQFDLFAGTDDDVATEPDLFSAVESNCQTIDTVEHTYYTIESVEELKELVEELGKCTEFAFDTETTGFDVFNDSLVGISFAVREHEAWYLPCNKDNIAEYIKVLKPLFESEKIEKIGQNIKFDMLVLRAQGVEVKGKKWDTMIMHYLLNPEARHNMDSIAEQYLNYSPIRIEKLIGSGAKKLTMDRVAVEQVSQYAAEDADVTLQLHKALKPLVEQGELLLLYNQIEEPLIAVLADIEWEGVKVDVHTLTEYRSTLHAELVHLDEQIREQAQEPQLNINSPKQLGEVLFGKLRIDDKPKMTKTKQYRTDEEYLQLLSDRHPIVEMILEYRGLKKLLTTYIDALPALINPRTGHIHTSFNQTVTATGRLSSSNPNLQNIPIRDERGRAIRKAFVPSDTEHVLVSADYSQVELRLMAHLSGDEAMVEAFRSGEDIHRATAAKIFGVAPGEVTDEQRRRAKTANFGIIYGISAFGLSQRLKISRTEAKELIDGYFNSYPQVKIYMDEAIVHAREQGYVSTLFGRRRYLADIDSRNAIARGMAERNAINAPIQGSAADIMKIAMARVHNRMLAEGVQSNIILQVHDELVVNTLRSEQEQVCRILKEEMERSAELKVALTVDAGVGENWLEAH